jgi:circadian clock protein KaiB
MTSTGHRPAPQDFTPPLPAVRLPIAAGYELTLFVSGASDASAHAIANVREICDVHLSGRHHLDIVDLNQEPALAERYRVLATPTLVKHHPLPVRMLVGEMSDHRRILVALDAPPAVLPDAHAADVV